ncbi:MAG: LLM class flavin-dependent oxidoreductase [Candidatus Limnocylindrales bacterium]
MRDADDIGFDSIWVMDHFFQIRGIGPADEPMLEGWTTLGFMAAHSSRARLGLMVGGVHYRQPGLWVKAATTLDVLSGGRAWLGHRAPPGTKQESRRARVPVPALASGSRCSRSTLAIAHGMWSGEHGSEEAFEGRQFQAERLLNSPQSLSRPRSRSSSAAEVRRRPCGSWPAMPMPATCSGPRRRSPTSTGSWPSIARPSVATRTRSSARSLQQVALGNGSAGTSTPTQLIDRFGDLADAGAQHVIFGVRDVADPAILERPRPRGPAGPPRSVTIPGLVKDTTQGYRERGTIEAHE